MASPHYKIRRYCDSQDCPPVAGVLVGGLLLRQDKHLDNRPPEFAVYYTNHWSHMDRHNFPPISDVSDEVATLALDQIEVKSYVGGLLKSFERKAA